MKHLIALVAVALAISACGGTDKPADSGAQAGATEVVQPPAHTEAPAATEVPPTDVPTEEPTAPADQATVTVAPAVTKAPPGFVSRAMLGDEWPFTVDSGQIKCTANQVTFTADTGTTYAVNGTAIDQTDYPEIDAIWAPNPAIPGTKVNIGPIIERGLALCK